jgi:N-acetylmuramoyl-L-alanine amidase
VSKFVFAPLAALGLLAALVPQWASAGPPAELSPGAQRVAVQSVGVSEAATVVVRPRIVSHPIPFGKVRKRQMARYSLFHYGVASWQLQPRGVVQHYTATNSLQSVFATFASNQPDPELGQKPGTCTHFVIDRDGTIYQLVPLTIRCRHAVGLNDSMIGVEHVGTSDAAVMGNDRQRRASLRLTLWLMSQYGFGVGDVIGHNESRSSRYHHELYRPWRCQTHGDFRRATMKTYRHNLAKRASAAGLDTTPPRWQPTGC